MTYELPREPSNAAMSPRDVNRLAVLDLVFREPGVVRTVAQARTGLSKATIYRVVEELTNEGFLVEHQVLGAAHPRQAEARAVRLTHARTRGRRRHRSDDDPHDA